ncbi:hypothetical protein D3C76_942100 [compost metagenome]
MAKIGEPTRNRIPATAGPNRNAPEPIKLLSELNRGLCSGGMSWVMYDIEVGPNMEPAIWIRKTSRYMYPTDENKGKRVIKIARNISSKTIRFRLFRRSMKLPDHTFVNRVAKGFRI